MKRAVLLVALALTACADTGVMQVGPGRYRITEESAWTVGTAEASVIRKANEHCAASGLVPNIDVTNSRPMAMYMHYAGASIEFRCVPRTS